MALQVCNRANMQDRQRSDSTGRTVLQTLAQKLQKVKETINNKLQTHALPVPHHHLVSLVHGQVTIIFVVSVCLSVCLFVCAEFFSAVFDPISIKLGCMLYVWV